MRKTTACLFILACINIGAVAQTPSMVQDINIGINPVGVCPASLYAWNGYLYFFSDDSVHGRELWRYNEQTPATMVQDYFPGTKGIGGGRAGDDIVAYKNKLFFGGDSTYNSTSIGRMYTYDGTGSIKLATGFPLNKFTFISNLTLIGNNLYFTADSGGVGISRLWHYDGNAAPVNVPLPVGSFDPFKLLLYKGKYYFVGNATIAGTSSVGLHTLDTVTNLVSLVPGIENVFDITVGGNKLYILGSTDSSGRQLHSFDGITLTKLTNIQKRNTTDAAWPPLMYFDSSIYFTTITPVSVSGYELYRFTPRTNSGGQVNTIAPGLSAVGSMFIYKKNLYMAGRTNGTGIELWKYDGITGSLVADINPGAADGCDNYILPPFNRHSSMAVFNNHLYFRANDGIHGMELWTLNDPTTGIQQRGWQGQVCAYPNPSSASAALRITLDKAQLLSVSVSDACGKQILNSGVRPFEAGKNEIKVIFQSRPAGQYLYRIFDSQGMLLATGVMSKY